MKEKNKKGNRKMRKGLWSPEEDERLMSYMVRSGQGCWSDIARNAGLQRCGKSCRLRWINYLRPDLKRGAFSPQEEALILHLHSILGNRWSQIAARIPGRTDNEIKNFWNSTIKKRLKNTNNLRPSPTTTTITTTTPPNNANIPFSTASIQELDTTNVATYSLTAMPTFLCKDNSSPSSASSFSSYNSQLVEPISHHDQLFLGNTIIQNEMIMGNLGFGEFVNVDLMQDELGVAPTCVGSNGGGGSVWEQNGHGNCTRMGVDSNIFVTPYSLGFNRGPVFGDFGAKVVENIEEKGAAKCMKVEGKINVIDSNPVINFQNIGDNLDLPFAGESSRSVGDQWDLETLLLGEASLPFLDFHA